MLANLQENKAKLDELRKRKAQIACVPRGAPPHRWTGAHLHPVSARSQTEEEYNEKLARTLQDLQQAGAEKQEKESEIRFRETLQSLKRTFPGVRGRIIDLCKPTHQKYGVAVTTVLGRNIDSVVVDTEKTAISCIEVG